MSSGAVLPDTATTGASPSEPPMKEDRKVKTEGTALSSQALQTFQDGYLWNGPPAGFTAGLGYLGLSMVGFQTRMGQGREGCLGTCC